MSGTQRNLPSRCGRHPIVLILGPAIILIMIIAARLFFHSNPVCKQASARPPEIYENS